MAVDQLHERLTTDLGGPADGLDDVLVARAPAQVARDRLAGLLGRRVRVVLEVGRDRGDEPRCAEAALQPVALGERLLHRAHRLGVVADALDGGDLVGLGRDREHQARAHRLAVDEHGARAAHAVLAADVGAGEAQVVAQEVGQQPPRRCLRRPHDAVDPHPDAEQRLRGRPARLAHAAPSTCVGAQGRGDRSPGQLGGQHPSVVGARVDVGLGVDVAAHELDHRVGDRARQRHTGIRAGERGREVEHRRHRGDRDERGAGRAHRPVVVDLEGDGHPGDGVVAVAAGGLEERGAGAGREAAEPHRLDELVVGQGRLERPLEEVGRCDLASTLRPDGLDDAAGEQEHRGHLAGGVGVRDRADRGAAVADRRVGDVAQRLAQEGERGLGGVVALEPRVPDECAHPHPRVGDVDGIQPGDAVDVDEVAGAGQPHVEHGDQALPAGEHLAVVADLGQHGDGLVDGAGCVVHERCGLHLGDPACSKGLGKGTAPPGRSLPPGGAVCGAGRRTTPRGGQGRRSRSGSRSPGAPG